MPKKKSTTPKQPEKIEPLWIDPPEKIWRFDFGKFSFGLFLVIIGLLYLAKNTGWLPLNLQFDIWQLWPMLLIFFGLSFVSGKGLSGVLVGSIFTMTVLVIATIFIADKVTLRLDPELTNLSMIEGHLPSATLTQNYPIIIDQYSTSRSANISIKHELGILNISGNSNKLITGNLSTNYAKLLTNSQTVSSTQAIAIESISKNSRAETSFSELTLQLSNTLPINLSLETGIANADLNFNNLLIKNLNVNSKGSTINLSLTNQDFDQNLKFTGQVSALTINLPADAAIKITGPEISQYKIENLKSANESLSSKTYQSATTTINLNLEFPPETLTVNWQ